MTATATTPAALDMPALDGRTVTEAHVRICAERGHATHTVDGVDTGVCPRCGEATADPAPAAIERDAEFDAIIAAEGDVAANTRLSALGMTLADRHRGADALGPARARLAALLDTLLASPERAARFGAYRAAWRDGRV